MLAVVHVPEAAMYKYDGSIFWKGKVWLAGQCAVVQAIAKSLLMQVSAYRHLWPCILAPNAGHHSAAGFAIDDVGHR